MLFKGTPTRRPIDITRAIEGRGGNFNAMTGEESTCYYAHMPNEYLGEAVDILSDMYLRATVPEDEFDREKMVVLEEIKMYADEPDAVAFAEPVTEVRPLPEAAKVEEPRQETPAAESAPAPAAAPRQAKVDAPPRPRRTIRPDYPAEARRRGIEGETTLELTVDAAGRVSSVAVAVSSGHPELDAAALRAVKAAEFTPAQSGGSPVESSARLKLVFRLK